MEESERSNGGGNGLGEGWREEWKEGVILGWENIPRYNISDHASNSAICCTFTATSYLEQLLPGGALANQSTVQTGYLTTQFLHKKYELVENLIA